MYVLHVCFACMFCMYVLHVCFACMFCMFVLHVCFVCMFCMYVLHVCFACMFCLYVMHVCFAWIFCMELHSIKNYSSPSKRPSIYRVQCPNVEWEILIVFAETVHQLSCFVGQPIYLSICWVLYIWVQRRLEIHRIWRNI